MSKHIRTKSDSDEGDSNFDYHFPLFIFTLRDFVLDLEIDGREVNSDEYLEHCLTLKPDKPEYEVKYTTKTSCKLAFS